MNEHNKTLKSCECNLKRAFREDFTLFVGGDETAGAWCVALRICALLTRPPL
jgi:hypothetical protein